MIQSGYISRTNLEFEVNMRTNSVKLLGITYTKYLAHWLLYIRLFIMLATREILFSRTQGFK